MREEFGGTPRRPLLTAGVALGIGLGGFLDGIVFHQILQLHHMFSARFEPTTVAHLEFNMLWDGVFHAFTWAMTVLGVAQLFHAARRPEVPWCGRTLVGASLAGWGAFNLVEGAVDHHLLEVHHVVERLGASVWDWAFLASGVLLIGAGVALIRSSPASALRRADAAPGHVRPTAQ
jgi:uncharacterized membrane protein